MILAGGDIIDVVSGRIYKGDILINGCAIAGIGSVSAADTNVIDVSGRHVAPGFVDSHLHIESSMLSPVEFSKAAVRHGTTSVLVDPHEIANVLGTQGVGFFLEQADLVPLGMFVGIPSCVPATELEDAGASLTLEDVGELVNHPRVYGLAEMMDFPGIVHGDRTGREKVKLVYDYGKIVDGHCPGLTGEDLLTYVTNGRNDGVVRIMSDHECSSAEEAREKLSAGMYIALRYGSASKDLDRILPALIETGIDLGRVMLCSDDLDAVELYEDGHVDRIIKRARQIILDQSDLSLEQATLLALSLGTVNPANYILRFLRLCGHPEIGHIDVGRRADLVVLESLESLAVDKVIHDGRMVVDGGQYIGEDPGYDYRSLLGSVNVAKPMSADDFGVRCRGTGKTVDVKVIGAIEGRLETRLLVRALDVDEGGLRPDPRRDISKLAVIERHKGSGSRAIGFVEGLGVRRGAIASTVAHDSHNLIVAGADDESMARAANHLRTQGGGMVVVVDDRIDYCPLRIGGLMSTEPIEVVVADYKALIEASRRTGSNLENVFMTLSFLSLPVLPELRLTNRGLVDVSRFEIVSLKA